MKIKLIDLVIKDINGEKTPKFWWNGCIHEIDEEHKIWDTYCKCYKKIESTNELNDEVKTIEEKTKKIDEEHNFYSYSKYDEIKNEVDKILYILKPLNRLEEKTSNLAKAVNYLLEKSDKE